MAEPTSTLTFHDLILELTRKLGSAEWGDEGDEELQIPSEPHDLAEAKRMVNNAIRMFINDAPPSGWRWAKPVGSFTLWGSVSIDATNTVTFAGYDPASNKSTITVTSAAFFETMEEKTLTLTTTGDQTITNFISETSVKVLGELTSAIDGETFSVTSDGNFTLPTSFGEVSGEISFSANANRGVSVGWASDSIIRELRANNEEGGDPWAAAVRVKTDVIGPRRRKELMAFPAPNANIVVEFPFEIGFEKLVDFTDLPPTPQSQDENIKAAVLAIGDKEGDEVLGIDWQEYKSTGLAAAYRIDSKLAPRRLGSFHKPRIMSNAEALRVFRSQLFERPNVTFNP